MGKSDLLVEKEALLHAVISERSYLLQLVNNRSRRSKTVHQAAERIRALRIALLEETRTLRRARGISGSESEVNAEVQKWTKRIAELTRDVAHLKAQRRIERLLKMAAEINAMEEAFPQFKKGALPPDEVKISDIVS